VPFLEKSLLPPDLVARLKECQPDPGLDCVARGQESVLVRDGATGKTLVEPGFPGIRRLQIKKTRRIWGEGIDVQFDKSITSIETPSSEGVTASFSDGTSATGSVLIGTDGGSSFVRGWLLPDQEAWDLGYNFLNFSFQLPADQAQWVSERAHPIVDVGTHPRKPMYSGIFILDKPDLERPETWVFYVLSTWPKEPGVSYDKDQDLLAEYRRRMADWGSPYKEVADWIPKGTRVRTIGTGLKVFAPKGSWDNRNGRVTMAGDAAHAMTFHRGQGGNNALKDAERFVAAMIEVTSGRKTLAAAMDEYDSELLQRGAAEVEMSSKQTHAFHDFDAFLQSPIMKHGIKPTATV
jgi:2-polyprenyl-6-methoxyphenol hydroxylase-like FAD-dependent oxidoreductase